MFVQAQAGNDIELLGGTRALKALLTLTSALPVTDRQLVIPASCWQQRLTVSIHLRPEPISGLQRYSKIHSASSTLNTAHFLSSAN